VTAPTPNPSPTPTTTPLGAAAGVATRPAGAGRRPLPARRRNGLGANVSSAIEALYANRLRSLLTALGVIVGVAAVIGAVTLTSGTSASINGRFANLGTNTLTITSGSTSSFGARGGAGSAQTLTPGDATAVGGLAHVSNVSPIIGANEQLIYGDQNWSTTVQGVYPGYESIGNWQVAEGAWFSQADETAGNTVAVLGQYTEQQLFATSANDPVGQTILIGGQSFTIAGVLQAKGSGSTFGRNQDDVVYVPFSAAQARLSNSQYVSQIQVQADNANDVTTVQTEITSLLEQRHNIPAGGTDDFTVRSATQFVSTAQNFSQTLTLLLVGIAAISLIVGGIGIMNIMLVSVTERTREIGIRMAIGARRRDIRDQFLIEALALSIVGGVMGILIGLMLGYALTNRFGVPFTLNPGPILLAFGVSAVIGVAFGFYPAVRASRLDPIEALRTE
jgi:putative ABC transport system permease protein